MNIQSVKQRFGIIGNSRKLNRALEIAIQVAETDLSVLIQGESGTGKEIFPQLIHQLSSRKHGGYIAVNCGAIPEGTIDSELFGHEKGAYTGAYDKRKGYFEVADKGTIFLDEVAELPTSTQVRLLRVLETGEFIKVGSSKVIKTNVRVIAATNIDIMKAISEGNFREDLFFRLNSVPISIPHLRERGPDIHLLFRKFASDFSEKYTMPEIKLSEEAIIILTNYRWQGNVRQLKNITEQMSIIEESRLVSADLLKKYLPDYNISKLPAIYKGDNVDQKTFSSEREILYKILFDMKNDMHELKQTVKELAYKAKLPFNRIANEQLIEDYSPVSYENSGNINENIPNNYKKKDKIQETKEIVEENLSLAEKEKELIKKALVKHNNKRKIAAAELGISERTLYRKLKEYKMENN